MFSNKATDEVVLLGIPSSIQSDKEEPTATKVGGKPHWYHNTDYNLDCTNCKTPLRLLCQVYAPIENKHRTLYIFGCYECPSENVGSWKVIRQDKQEDQAPIKASEEAPQPPTAPVQQTSSGLWQGNDDWSVSDDSDCEETENPGCRATSNANDILELEALLSGSSVSDVKDGSSTSEVVSTTNENEKQGIDKIKAIKEKEIDVASGEDSLVPGRCYILDIAEEYSTDSSGLSKEMAMLEKYNAEQREQGGEVIDTQAPVSEINARAKGSAASGEAYESGKVSDKRLIYFMETVSLSPTQCFRYAYGGGPLWPGVSKKLQVPPCSCGATRDFEVQIVPGILDAYSKVNPDDESQSSAQVNPLHTTGFDFLSLLVYSCRTSCGSEGQEHVVVLPAIV